MNIKKIALLTVATVGMIFTPMASAFADTATVSQAPEINNSQTLKPDESIKNDADKASQSVADNAIKNKQDMEKSASQNAGNTAKDIAEQVVGGAQETAGTNKDYTGQDLGGFFTRASKLTDTLGSGIISNLVKFLYYASFVGIFLSLIMIIISLFSKKMKTSKYILGILGCIIVFGVISGVAGFNLIDNPATDVIKYIFNQ